MAHAGSRRGEKTVNRTEGGKGRESEISFRGGSHVASTVSRASANLTISRFSSRRFERGGSIFTSEPTSVDSLPGRGEKIRRVCVLLLSTPNGRPASVEPGEIFVAV